MDDLHSVGRRATRLAWRPDQRAAATAPPGPSLCIAPAGPGKTTTLVARVAWLVATGTPADAIRAITFNKRAADELTERLDAALAPLGVGPGAVRVRTFHALGREILRDAGGRGRAAGRSRGGPAASRPGGRRGRRGSASTRVISRLKLELRVDAARRRADPDAGPIARAFVDYERAVAATRRRSTSTTSSSARSGASRPTRPCWRAGARRCRASARRRGPGRRPRAARPGAPARGPGEPDLPRRRRRPVDLRLAARRRPAGPGARRAAARAAARRPRGQLPLPAPGRRAGRPAGRAQPRAVREDDPRRAGGARPARPRAGPVGRARPPRASDRGPGRTTARPAPILARTNRELLPAVAVALELGVPFRAPRIDLLARRPPLSTTCSTTPIGWPSPGDRLLVTIGRLRSTAHRRRRGGSPPSLLAWRRAGWAVRGTGRSRGARGRRSRARRARLADLRRDDAAADARHGARDEGPRVRPRRRDRDGGRPLPERPGRRRTPTSRSRRYEEERRLAYVAWTRARRSLPCVTTRPRPRRSCSRRSSRPAGLARVRLASRRDRQAVARLSSRMSRSIGVEERLGQRVGQDVAHRILRRRRPPGTRSAVGRSATGLVVAQAVGHRLEEGDPAGQRPGPRPRPAAVRRSGAATSASLVDGRDARAAPVRRPSPPVPNVSHPTGGSPSQRRRPPAPAGGARRSSGRRLRSEPLTRIRNE